MRGGRTHKQTRPGVKTAKCIHFSWQVEESLVDWAGKVSDIQEFDPHSVSKQHTGAPTVPISLFFVPLCSLCPLSKSA